jgi:hypothetical protein
MMLKKTDWPYYPIKCSFLGNDIKFIRIIEKIMKHHEIPKPKFLSIERVVK